MHDSDDTGIVFLQDHLMREWKFGHVHLGMPYSKFGTDGINLSILVLKLMKDFNMEDKVIAYTSNEGYNLKMCQDAMEWNIPNTAIYRTQKLCFVKIVLTMRYKVHARQPFWIESPRITRA